MVRSVVAAFALMMAVVFGSTRVVAEVLIMDSADDMGYHGHPVLRSLVFISPETRAQAILPPAAVFVAPAPLIWRAPGTISVYPPPSPLGFNSPGSPSNRDVVSYNLARAHAFSQNLYRRDGEAGNRLWFGPFRGNAWSVLGDPLLYPPLAPGLNHPSNRDNSSYLLERAHRFSQDDYRKR